MKLQIISVNRGFLLVEIIMAISLFTIFIITIYTFSSSFIGIKKWSLEELDTLKKSVKLADKYINERTIDENISISQYGNHGKYISIGPISFTQSDYISSWGDNTCNPRIESNINNLIYFPNGIDIGIDNPSTDIIVKNNIIYATTDSNISSYPDFYIIDNNDYNNPSIISSINTGPGASALAIAGPFAYIANTSTNSQLQIIDIHNRSTPILVSSLKLPLSTATTTASKSNSIFYRDGFIYLGTNKWNGNEFNIIDVRNPAFPILVGGFETDTLINDIFVIDNLAYIASSNIAQFRVIDITDKANPQSLSIFSPSGYQTQEGRIIDFFESNILLGRTVGGFNNISNHEIFISSSTFNSYFSKDIPTGVYGVLIRDKIYLLTHSIGEEFQIWDSDIRNRIYTKALNLSAIKMKCDGNNLYFATGNNKIFSLLRLSNE